MSICYNNSNSYIYLPRNAPLPVWIASSISSLITILRTCNNHLILKDGFQFGEFTHFQYEIDSQTPETNLLWLPKGEGGERKDEISSFTEFKCGTLLCKMLQVTNETTWQGAMSMSRRLHTAGNPDAWTYVMNQAAEAHSTADSPFQ